MSGRRVVVVTGGGGGIGAAIAFELGRRGDHVVTVDPLVTSDGTGPVAAPAETTADRIAAAGGSAVASPLSVTDGAGVAGLFADLVAEHGRLDAVVNVAGISRPTSFARGSEDDWWDVIEVHLEGYLNVLRAALPIMAAAGRGQVLGVTSGSGWRAADAGAYGVAKRAVAALTWELGAVAPDGVRVNAISPIAVTRMVTEALERAAAARGGSTATGGLALGSMPEPSELAPVVAHVLATPVALRGRVLFTGGPEVALVEPPRLIEVVPVGDLAAAVPLVLVPAEAAQASTGGSNPRLGREGAGASSVGGRCLVMGGGALGVAVTAALEAREVDVTREVSAVATVDAVVLVGPTGGAGADDWEGVLASCDGLADQVHGDATSTLLLAVDPGPRRIVTIVDGGTAGGRSQAQAAAQLARAAVKATKGRMAVVAVSVEGAAEADVATLATHLVADPAAVDLSGAELVAGPGWVGLRAHPRPGTSINLGGPEVPAWFDAVLEGLL